MRIYTRRGDFGTTGIHGGERVPKTDIRIEANGTLDELNSLIGVVRSVLDAEDKDIVLRGIQTDLMAIMSVVATPSAAREENPRRLPFEAVERLEKNLDAITAKGCITQEFVLPGGIPAAAFLHQARTVCRRVERRLWMLNEKDPVDEEIMMYINRLSDLLFAMARETNSDGDVSDERWRPFNCKV